jgi:prepilin-type processing-associated H-X9-DG protein
VQVNPGGNTPGNGARHRCTPRGAFALVELLVVIGVIAVLLSLLLPAVGGARSSSKSVVCLGNLYSIGHSVLLYAGDNKDHYPLSSHTEGSLGAPGAWLQSLDEYGVIPALRLCPADPARDQRLTSYATNDHFEPLTPGIDFNPITHQPLPGGRRRALVTLSLIPRPCATVYVVEPLGDGTIDHIHSIGWSRPDQVGAVIAVTRHLGAANYLFADGHAAPISWATIQSTFSAATSMFDPETAR